MVHVVDELQHGTQNYGLILKTYEWADGISPVPTYVKRPVSVIIS